MHFKDLLRIVILGLEDLFSIKSIILTTATTNKTKAIIDSTLIWSTRFSSLIRGIEISIKIAIITSIMLYINFLFAI